MQEVRKNEWRVKYLVKTANPYWDEMRQRDYAADQAIMMAKHDVPEAMVTVLYVNRTPKGYYSVEVLRKRTIAGDAS